MLKLPYPVSTNRYWRHFRNQQVLSREAKHYRQEAAWLAKAAGMKPLTGQVELHVRIVPRARKDGTPSEVLPDLDNCLKVLIDALQGIAYENDKQVKKIVADYAPYALPSGAAMVGVYAYQAA